MNKKNASQPKEKKPKGPSIFLILVPYKRMIALLAFVALAMNALTLSLPKIVSHAIDTFIAGEFNAQHTTVLFGSIILAILCLAYLLSIIQTIASERVGRDIRTQLADKISRQTFGYVREVSSATLLTNVTSDIDAIKQFVAQAVSSIIASLVTIIGASIILLSINWKLGLAVLTILPIIAGTFSFVLKRVRALFLKTREVIDWLNRVINESILGAPLIRIVFSQQQEYNKFYEANNKAKSLGLDILKLFSAMIPIITFVASMATVIILALGGHFVINDTMTLGDFAAFNSYVSTLIFPIFVIGFMSNVIAQATASYGRVASVLNSEVKKEEGSITNAIRGDIEFKNVSLQYATQPVLKDVSLHIVGGKKTAIIGPTAAGKTQLLYLMVNLIAPDKGTILYDNVPLAEYDTMSLHTQIGLVFQDSILFNVSVRENIAFREDVTDEALQLAIRTAELQDFIDGLPEGLETIVSERGTSLSGGQKQRIMLARALAIHPSIILLDDFTARVDTQTEKKILHNIEANYPNVTLVSVTQKIASVEHFDQVILMMEGEVVAAGTHEELLKTVPEYIQIYGSQQSTHAYE